MGCLFSAIYGGAPLFHNKTRDYLYERVARFLVLRVPGNWKENNLRIRTGGGADPLHNVERTLKFFGVGLKWRQERAKGMDKMLTLKHRLAPFYRYSGMTVKQHKLAARGKGRAVGGSAGLLYVGVVGLGTMGSGEGRCWVCPRPFPP